MEEVLESLENYSEELIKMDRKLRFETTYRRLGGLYKPGMWHYAEKKLPDAWRNLRKKEEEIERKWDITSDAEFKALCGNLSKLIAILLVKARKKDQPS